MKTEINVSVVLYQEGTVWIAQGLEYDVMAEASSLPEAHQRFAAKVASEIVMALEAPFTAVGPAPQKFWKMFQDSGVCVNAEEPPFRITGDGTIPRILSRMKVGQLDRAA